MNLLDQEIILKFLYNHYEIFIFSVFFGTFVLTYYLIPKVLWVSREKNLTAKINERSSHTSPVPAFGGVAFYISIILLLSILQSMRLTFVGNHLIAAITVLFMVGLKDDLVVSSARVKLLGQITATLFLIFSPELKLTNLHGFLGFYEIYPIVGHLLKVFLLIALINAYNLIDGIDGLGAITGIIGASAYGWIFFQNNQPYYVLVASIIIGMLGAFLRYNFSRGRKKMFMGDSGSLVIGLLLGFLTLRYLGMPPTVSNMIAGYGPSNRLLFLTCILFIPIFDTLRVILIRLANGKSPFKADRNHIHNVLLDLGLSHIKVSVSLGLLNLIIISLYFYLSENIDQGWLVVSVLIIYMTAFLVFHLLKTFGKKTRKFLLPQVIKEIDVKFQIKINKQG